VEDAGPVDVEPDKAAVGGIACDQQVPRLGIALKRRAQLCGNSDTPFGVNCLQAVAQIEFSV
jgi:hypothetical protein